MKEYNELVEEELASLRTELAAMHGNCTRSHPHEEMNVVCQLRTKLARADFELAAERDSNARLLAANKDCLLHFDEMRSDLAAVQLDNQLLREALASCRGSIKLDLQQYEQLLQKYHDCEPIHSEAINAEADRLQALIDLIDYPTPTNTAALDAYVAEKVEPWKKDAERYQWLKSDGKMMTVENVDDEFRVIDVGFHLVITDWFYSFDEAIDAAIAAQEPKA